MSTFRIHISFQEWPSSFEWLTECLIVLTLMSVSLLLNSAVQGSRTSSTKHRSIASKFYATLDFIILSRDFVNAKYINAYVMKIHITIFLEVLNCYFLVP